MPHIRLRDVQAEYELLTVRDYNLKRQLLEAARRRIDPPAVIRALNGVNLDLPEGSRLGLVGANGAGKSTLLSVMAGLLPPTSGSVKVAGRVLALLGSAAAGLDQEAAGLDNIVSMGVQLGETPSAMRRRTDDITDFSGLGGRIAHPVYTYSSGMQTRLRFSILTSLRPDILLIDEGIGTADAEFAERASQRLDEFVSGAGILVLASHGDALLQQQCDTAVWLHQGSIMRSGRLEPILAEYHASYQVDPTDDAPKTLQARVRDLSAPAPPAPARSPRVIDSPVTPTENTTLTPGHEADVTRGYWELLDRAPDPDGLALHAARLREGLPLEQLRRDLHTSPEAQAIRDAWSGEVYLGLSHDIPYSSTPRPGAQHLVVSFPGVGTHRFIPAADDPVIDDIAVHRLALGLARARPWKAAEWTSWVHDAAALIHQVAEQLGVELANVICVGASTKGTRALWVGLVAAVGHVAVGSPAMPMGTSLEKLYLRARGDVDSWILFESLYVPSGFADDLSQRDAMDRVIPHAVGAAQHPCDIQLFASRGDVFWKPCEDFVESLAGHRSLTGSLVEGDYRGHNAVGPQYNAFLRRILLTLVRPKRSTRVKPESVGARPARGTKKG